MTQDVLIRLKTSYWHMRLMFKRLRGCFVKGPGVLAIEFTNRCNANCIMCGRDEICRPGADMDFQHFQQIVDNAAKTGISIFQLSFYGEVV